MKAIIDGNEAAASVAYRLNELCSIYPITPSSTMAELADEWSAQRRRNIFGTVPTVIEMQSEGGAAGALHGALQGGALSTTFTASQGLLLMIPNMYKIAGELTSTVFHVAARSLAAQGLSIFGDHQDVMAVRQTGFALLSSASVQEAHDLAVIAQVATLRSRVPFLHFFDGFRTSHELNTIDLLGDDDLRALVPEELIRAHRRRALSPEHPIIRGTAQNPDTYFQSRETVNPYYLAVPGIVERAMDSFAARTGRGYRLVEYHGHPEADRVILVMGSGAQAVRQAVDHLSGLGQRVGCVQLRLYRPFPVEQVLAAIPASAVRIAVLDRTKEPGASGEPLFLDVVAALGEASVDHGDGSFGPLPDQRDGSSGPLPDQMDHGDGSFGPLPDHGDGSFGPLPDQMWTERTVPPDNGRRMPTVIGGRYGLSSKEFTPPMVVGIFDELALPKPRPRFTIGITDDVTRLSLPYPSGIDLEDADTHRAVFYGLGSDGTVGANKNTIKILGGTDGTFAQGYFVYDSKKSGSRTVSHLRFGPRPIEAPYLVGAAGFIGCHHWSILERVDVLEYAREGTVLLVNAPHPPEQVFARLPRDLQEAIIELGVELWTIDAGAVARAAGMGNRTNTVLQTCFFAISKVLEPAVAIEKVKAAIRKTYARKGADVVARNEAAVDAAVAALHRVEVPDAVVSDAERIPPVPADAPEFVRTVTAAMLAGAGDSLPVSALPDDGSYPSGTTRYEKRNISEIVAEWDPEACIQCGNCAFVCPHAVLRAKYYKDDAVADAPPCFASAPLNAAGFPGSRYTLQVYAEDCTGCGLCVEACPVKPIGNPDRRAINLAPAPPRAEVKANVAFFESLPVNKRSRVDFATVRGTQFLEPLFEFSGACSGCGETPYLKLLTQLFGGRTSVANATGCSSIYGGNLPTTPWSSNKYGRGPAWSNSLFEDNAEFGLGLRLAADLQTDLARQRLDALRPELSDELVELVLTAPQQHESDLSHQRARVEHVKMLLDEMLTTGASPHHVTALFPLARTGDPDADMELTGRRGQPFAAEIEAVPTVRPGTPLGADRLRLVEDLRSVADHLLRRSVWIVGGDGWAYDIGSGGVDHVLASGRDVNVLVLDTEVYSNTGGQSSKSTPVGAVAKFAAAGKTTYKKDLAMQAIAYGNVYVARVAMGADPQQTLKAFREAEMYDGPSLILAYSHCIAHGIDMRTGLDQQYRAVNSGHWPLMRFNPVLREANKNPFLLDSPRPRIALRDYHNRELRFRMLSNTHPDEAERMLQLGQDQVNRRWAEYEELASRPAAMFAADAR